MKTPRTRTLIGAGAAGLALVGGLAVATGATASAQVPTAAPAVSTASSSDGDGEANDGQQDGQQDGVTGSLKAPSTQGHSESNESAALQGAATVSASEAEKAALAAVPGTVVKSGLGDENGWLIYEVTVKDGSGATTEVKVDAGSGTVLAHEAAGSESEGQGSESDAETADGAQG